MELVLETAGESHGACLVAILAGIPAGTPVDPAFVNARVAARQRGYGRSARQRVESDHARFLAGVRDDVATGNPIAIEVANRDTTYVGRPPVHTPRPGHADLAGALNRGILDAREVVERASARETAVRVAAGAVAAAFLEALGCRVLGHVVSIGGVAMGGDDVGGPVGDDLEAARARRDASDLHALGPAASQATARARIADAGTRGDTLGGVVEVVATGVPAGLGGHERPEEKISSRLAAACMGIQAVRGVELGLGFAAAALPGSAAQDGILPADGDGPPRREGNRAGGIEGGTTNGLPVVVRCAMKPLATLRNPLPSVDLRTGAAADARVERSDVTAVPSLAVVAEAVVALELARAVRRRFGGAHLDEVRAALAAHRQRMAAVGRRGG
ncbi:MAG: chorismate synthase [Planctomycetota bacterium]